jgi:sarcosine oxidase subunit gamma
MTAAADDHDVAARFEVRAARDVLQKGCAVDLHPRVFTSQSCVSTALARVRVTLRQSASERYELLVERSYARYLHEWLLDAALEYGQARASQ